MKELISILKKHDLRTKSYEKIGNVIVIDSNKGKLVLKKKNTDIYEYLSSRNFNYYPKHIYDNDYEIMEYVENINMPKEQKILDLINLVSLLHSKTTFFKNVDIDDYKKTYEELKNKISYLNNYYNDIMTFIESKIYMSPSEQVLANNISIVFNALRYSNDKLDEWYKNVEDKHRRRYAIIHNNLDLNHFIRNNNSYLLSWDKSKIDLPIYDLYSLYKKYALDFDFKYIFKIYEKNYPLLKEEKELFNIMISIPDKIDFNKTLFDVCTDITNLIDYLYKTEDLILPNNSKDTKQDK